MNKEYCNFGVNSEIQSLSLHWCQNLREDLIRASLKEKSDVFKELDGKILATLDERCS